MMLFKRSSALAEARARAEDAERRAALAEGRAERAESRSRAASEALSYTQALVESQQEMLVRSSGVAVGEVVGSYLALLERGGSTSEIAAAREALASFAVREQ